MSRLIFGRVVGAARYEHNATPSGNPRPTVPLMLPGGEVVDLTWSADVAGAYGAGNPDRRDRVHAYELTAAGRLYRIERDATNAWHVLARHFPHGAGMSVLVDRPTGATSWRVRVLAAHADGAVHDLTGAVSFVTGRRRAKGGGVLVQGGGADAGLVVVCELAIILHGDPDALTMWRVS